ncbi:hypothetical protein C8J57DRAFT_1622474 [Mycena rebaudengoi]|nr:hypothetical protein C8J57DRAFT_1622474 [Mycena rebaudengoi]
MISLLLLAHTLSGRHLSPRATTFTDSCDNINDCRKLFDIIWGCLVTIFACTWVSVHPNVPPPSQSTLALLWRRLKMMLVAIIAPEVMVGFAARQFFISRWYANEHKISKTHGFFISMGGFVSHIGHHPITTPDTVPMYLDTIRAVDMGDITDKSKGDALSKCVAFAQGAWFMTQCFARFSQNLPVSELEVATLAFAVINVFIWLLWWNKPLDVQRPIMVIPVYDPQPMTLHTSVPSFWSSSSGQQYKPTFAFYMECHIGSIFGAIHCTAWNAGFASTVEMWMWRSCALLVTVIPLMVTLYIATARTGLFDSGPEIIVKLLYVLALLIYPIARIFLIVLPLISLRAPAAGSLMDVNWSVYIPHL